MKTCVQSKGWRPSITTEFYDIFTHL